MFFLLFLIRTDDVEQLVGAGGVAGVVGAVLVVPAVLHAGEINRGGEFPAFPGSTSMRKDSRCPRATPR